MDVTIFPGLLTGEVTAPSSKSAAHRALICAMLAQGTSQIFNIGDNDDIVATIQAATALGALCIRKGDTIEVTGIGVPPKTAIVDCNESGSTLRFFVPIAGALGITTTFIGRGELPNRPMKPLTSLMEEHGCSFCNTGRENEIFTVHGKLRSGQYSLPGNISSQYITGLLFALPLLAGESTILLETPLESSGYIDMTLDVINSFGAEVEERDNTYYIKKSSPVKPSNFTVEGDYSGAAFWLAANVLGSSVSIAGLRANSLQGDRKILSVLEQFSDTKGTSGLQATKIHATEIPDLVPILAVVATQATGTTTITGAARLRIKECDRLIAMTEGLTRLGAKITEQPDGLIIQGPTKLSGGRVSSFDDHRIAMALSIAATVASESVTIIGAECVSKSYPDFYQVFRQLGGNVYGL